MQVLNQISTILQMGFIYGIVAIGVYITYRILDIADLSVDGTFPLGGAVFSVLLTGGCPWYLAMIASFISGALAGCFTGILHVKLKINALLSGIITMTALLSINYLIGGTQISFAKDTTLLNNGLLDGLNIVQANYVRAGLLLIIVLVCKFALDIFLKTKCGFMLRATGNNPQLVTQLGKNTDNYKMLGLAIANGFVSLSGSLYCQYGTVYNSSMGTGTVVLALTCVIIGCVLAKNIKIKGKKLMRSTAGVIWGALVYYAVLLVAMNVLGSEYTKLVVALMFVCVLLFDSGFIGEKVKKLLKRRG